MQCEVKAEVLCQAEKGMKASKKPTESRWGASYSLQLRILFIRAIKTRRFDSMSSQDFFQFIVVGVLTGEGNGAITLCCDAFSKYAVLSACIAASYAAVL